MSLIIPIKCFTCGNILADRYSLYLLIINKTNGEILNRFNAYLDEIGIGRDVTSGADTYINVRTVKTREAHAMDFLQFRKMCCRRHILTQVDMD